MARILAQHIEESYAVEELQHPTAMKFLWRLKKYMDYKSMCIGISWFYVQQQNLYGLDGTN